MNLKNMESTKMKKLTFLITAIVITLLFTNVAFAELVEVKVGKGTLKVGGILQAGYTYHLEDAEGFDSFTLNRGRFLFWGDIVPDKVKYFVQLETKGGTGMLDYKARFFYIDKTEITVGRFLPSFTLYMPYSTAKLEMINYPLTTQKFAMWRQVGLQTTTKTEFVDFNFGIFNGADQKNNTSDNNDAKDFLFRAEFKPTLEQADLRLGGYAWIGSALATYDEAIFVEETLKKNRFGGFLKFDMKEVPLKIRGEFVMGSDEFVVDTTAAGVINTTATVDAMAFFGHIGYKVTPKVEILARYDIYDPNTDVDDDGISWFTVGVNHYLEGLNSMFYLNYIAKMEQGTSVDDDLIQAQVQILF